MDNTKIQLAEIIAIAALAITALGVAFTGWQVKVAIDGSNSQMAQFEADRALHRKELEQQRNFERAPYLAFDTTPIHVPVNVFKEDESNENPLPEDGPPPPRLGRTPKKKKSGEPAILATLTNYGVGPAFDTKITWEQNVDGEQFKSEDETVSKHILPNGKSHLTDLPIFMTWRHVSYWEGSILIECFDVNRNPHKTRQRFTVLSYTDGNGEDYLIFTFGNIDQLSKLPDWGSGAWLDK